MLVDTHAHLNLEPLVHEWDHYVRLAEGSLVSAVIIPGTNLETSQKAVDLAQVHPLLHAAVGIHPEDVTETSDIPKLIHALAALAHQPRVVAIGEVGLDYKHANDDEALIDKQRELFRAQLQLANDIGLAVSIHTRRSRAMFDACDDVYSVFRGRPFRGVFHCFSGGKNHVLEMLPLSAYFGVGGLITYSHNQSLRKVIRGIPLERLVLETDAPWLLPKPLEGTYNHPGHVTIVAQALAEIFSISVKEIIHITGQNARELFKLK